MGSVRIVALGFEGRTFNPIHGVTPLGEARSGRFFGAGARETHTGQNSLVSCSGAVKNRLV